MTEVVPAAHEPEGGEIAAAHRTLLLVDDEDDSLELLSQMLSRSPYHLLKASDAQQALEILQHSGDQIAAVLLDRMLPGLDGMHVLRQIKADKAWRDIPVIMQTAAGNRDQINEGFAAGAYYYLVKPFGRSVLLPILTSAIHGHDTRLALAATDLQAAEHGSWQRSDELATHTLQTLEEARTLSVRLAALSPEPERIAFGLFELICNAIEHGNLEIGRELKRELLQEARLNEEVIRRLGLPKYRGRKVCVNVARSDQEIVYRIQDDGAGFDWRACEEIDPSTLILPNGRGILLARRMCFDALQYEDPGNSVRAVVRLAP